MEIEDTPIYQEVKAIIDDGPKEVAFYYKAIVHTPDADYEVVKVLNVTLLRDYVARAADIIAAVVTIPFGLWAKDIYPHRDNLEITISRKPLIEVGDEENEESGLETHRFFAVPNPELMPVVQATDYNKVSGDDLDRLGMFDIELQLTDRVPSKLRGVSVGGIFRRASNEDVVKSLLAAESSKVKTSEEMAFLGVDMVEPSNKEKREHIIIPQGTRIVDLPVYVQKYAGGLYNTGLGSYYQGQHWFVYPLFDTTRFAKAKRTMVVIKVPTVRAMGIERTYRQDGDVLYVIGTSNSVIDDDAGTNFTEKGNGTRFSDSRKYMRDIVKTSGNKAIASRAKTNHEFLSVDRGQDKNVAFLSRSSINSNPYQERTKLAARQGSVYEVMWENSSPFLTFPGMMCKIHYLDANEVKELHGVLHSVQVNVQLNGEGILTKRHSCTTRLVIFVNPPPDQDQIAEPEDEESIHDWTQYEST